MLFGDLKRAIEDTILKPETNRLSEIGKRTTIAALDLVQVEQSHSSNAPNLQNEAYLGSIGTLNSCSQEPASSLAESGYTTSSTTSESVVQPVQSFSSSNSLDTVVLRQSISCRPSLGTSRRSSRVLPHCSQTKRKRSNSVSSCLNKSRHTRQGTSSVVGVSCTSAGGASALSLPPTARQTPFRFGDLEDKSHFDLAGNEKLSSGFHLVSQEGSFATDPFGASQLGEATESLRLEKLAPNNECNSVAFIENSIFQDNIGMKPNARKSENEKFLRDVKLISMGTKDAFDGFRQQEGYDSDCDEEMECD
ncbi:unnamed protein product [Enterobius vermicularis]|uniref:Serine/threonine-protein kinase greatwall n=1 Tax=Enterobius vermicularis TaxID=51028 RepID=A0A0N4VJX6_ENTVE|nr:unnamed protein product [Enterobius vermicularis]